jgi:membrane-bound serine protease (ClpP class)
VRVGAKLRIMCGLGFMLAAPMMAMGPARAAEEGSATTVDLPPVDVVEVSGLLDRISADSIRTALERSATNGAQAVVLQVNTRGAVIGRDAMADLLSDIKNSGIPVAIWVGPSGSRLYGLPAQMVAVADVAAMAPGARIGRTGTPLEVDGAPVSFGTADDVLRSGTLGFLEAREQKVLKFAGDDRGVPVLRNILLAMDGVSVKGRTLDTVQDGIGENGQVNREATTTRFFKLGLVPRLFHTVASPPSAYLLFTVGLALLLFEFFTAGVGVAGLVGAVCLLLGAMGFGALPMNGLALVLVLAAFAAFAVDVQVGVPRFWTGAGMVLYVIGSFGLFRSVDGLSLRPGWITMATCIVGVALTYTVGMPSMTRTRFATPTIGRDNLVGETGTALGPVDPEGVVVVNGARWRARVNRSTPLADAQEMRVTGIDGITLEVEPLEGGARDYREMRKKD